MHDQAINIDGSMVDNSGTNEGKMPWSCHHKGSNALTIEIETYIYTEIRTETDTYYSIWSRK